MSSRAVPTSVSSPLLRFALRNFVIYNPLFLFSATLMLAGAWLLNPPQADGTRSIPLLLKLIGILQLYEFTVLGAGSLLAKRAGLERDVRNLMIVLAPFLLDITFTTSSLGASLVAQENFVSGMILALGVLALTGAKAVWASRLVGLKLSALEWTALLGGPALVILFPVLGALLGEAGYTAEIGLAGGLLLSVLVLLFGSAAAKAPESPVRKLAPLVLIAALVHTCGTVWTYSGDLGYVFGPTIIALGVVLPNLAWPAHADRDRVTAFVLPVVGMFVCGIPESFPLGLSGWQIGLWGMAAVQGVMFARHRSVHFLAGLLAAAHLSWGGATPAASLAAIGSNPLEPVVLLALFGYGLWKKAHPALLAPTLALAALSAANVAGLGLFDAVLGLDLLGLGILAWTHRAHGREPAGARARFAGTFLIFAPVSVLALVARDPGLADMARLVSWSSVALLLIPAVILRLRGYALPALLIPLQGAIEVVPQVAPESTSAWGAVVLFAGFVVVSLGVVVSLKREQILAWLERDEVEEREAGEPVLRRPRRPESWHARAALATALVAAVAITAVPAARAHSPTYPGKSFVTWTK